MSEKTEQPTAKKLRDARKKGQVAKSKEIVSAASIIVLLAFFWAFWPMWLENCKEMVLVPAQFYGMDFRDALKLSIDGVFKKAVLLCLPILVLAAVVGFLSNFFQTGAMFALESVKPDLKKINPVEGTKNIFSLKNLIELLKSIVKILFLSFLIYKVIKGAIDHLLKIPYVGIDSIELLLGEVMKQVAIYTIGAFFVVAFIDFFLQRYMHFKKLKMSKDEVKREYKEMEGDPIIKGKRKQLHREMANDDTIQRTRKATVLVTNPTRRAIALYYDKDDGKLPVVLSKGEDLLAKRMIEIAKEEGIPIMQNVPLARDLFEQANIDHYIPSDLIEPVAEVLRWVQQLERDRDGS